MATILVVGGAGYIGSHMVLQLLAAKHRVIVLDNLATGHRAALFAEAEFVEGSLADANCLATIFQQQSIDAVMHFAAYIEVGESVKNPAKYYANNLAGTLVLLDTMMKYQIKHFIFSSTAAIFGEPQYIPIDVQHPKHPLNPYGRSKWMVEQILQDYDLAYGLKFATLRYFNASGADPEGRIGECHDPESHLIPIVLRVANGRRQQVQIYGDDYPTPDGTCIRDYVHVVDLCSAHALALEKLISTQTSQAYNLGNGTGFSVKQVIDVAKAVTGRAIPTKMAPRRLGDPARLVADAKATIEALDWQIQYPNLTDIINHAWQWEQTYANTSAV